MYVLWTALIRHMHKHQGNSPNPRTLNHSLSCYTPFIATSIPSDQLPPAHTGAPRGLRSSAPSDASARHQTCLFPRRAARGRARGRGNITVYERGSACHTKYSTSTSAHQKYIPEPSSAIAPPSQTLSQCNLLAFVFFVSGFPHLGENHILGNGDLEQPAFSFSLLYCVVRTLLHYCSLDGIVSVEMGRSPRRAMPRRQIGPATVSIGLSGLSGFVSRACGGSEYADSVDNVRMGGNG